MPTPIIPISAPTVIVPPVRGLGWSVHREPMFSTLRQEASSGRTIRIPLQTQPLWKFTFTWNFISDGWAGLAPTVQTGNSPYTDLAILQGFFLSALGQGNEFLYKPPDAVKVDYQIAAPDANGNAAVTINRGGFFEQVQELNGILPTNIKQNGGATGAISYHVPNTVAGYIGYVLSASPAWVPSDVITCNFTYYYRCAFTEDSLDFEEFMYNLHLLQKLEIEQIRI